MRYQHLHLQVETLVYALALAAVIVAAFQTIFLPQHRTILIGDVVLMLAVFIIVMLNRQRGWHSKWMDYRFLAERFHSALFTASLNIDLETPRPPRHLSLAYSQKDWMVAAFSSVWSKRPQLEKANYSFFEWLKSFVYQAWIQDQIRYHDKASKLYHKLYYSMTVASYIIFGLTISVVLLLIIHVNLPVPFLAFTATIFPAIAASITTIRTQREYLRNSLRSVKMARYLEEIKDRLMATDDMNNLFEILKETEETMLHENEDWRVLVKFHKPEIPV